MCAANPTVQQRSQCSNTFLQCTARAAYGGGAGACGRNKVLQRFGKQEKHFSTLQDNRVLSKS